MKAGSKLGGGAGTRFVVPNLNTYGGNIKLMSVKAIKSYLASDRNSRYGSTAGRRLLENKLNETNQAISGTEQVIRSLTPINGKTYSTYLGTMETAQTILNKLTNFKKRLERELSS